MFQGLMLVVKLVFFLPLLAFFGVIFYIGLALMGIVDLPR